MEIDVQGLQHLAGCALVGATGVGLALSLAHLLVLRRHLRGAIAVFVHVARRKAWFEVGARVSSSGSGCFHRPLALPASPPALRGVRGRALALDYLIGKYPTLTTMPCPSAESTQSVKALISADALGRR
jgi:hypothetical protein